MAYLGSFIVGGLICVIGQILLDKTKLTSARILVLFVVSGCILGAFGLYDYIIDIGAAGATVPLPGFGYLIFKGVKDEVDSKGFIGILTGGLKASAAGISAAVIFSFLAALIFNPKEK